MQWLSSAISGYDPVTASSQYVYSMATAGAPVDFGGQTRIRDTWDPRRSGELDVWIHVEYSLADRQAFATQVQGQINYPAFDLYVLNSSGLGASPSLQTLYNQRHWAVARKTVTMVQDSEWHWQWALAQDFPLGRPYTFSLKDVLPSLRPNTKYWLLAVPTYQTTAQVGTSTTQGAVGDLPGGVDGNVRAISFWTDRDPAAPTITSPESDLWWSGGDTATLSFDVTDPDRISGSNAPAYTGVMGVEVQYAPLGSSNWTPVTTTPINGLLDSGGYAFGGPFDSTAPGGLRKLQQTLSVPIHFGEGSTPGAIQVPSGAGQLRLRYFTYPYANAYRFFEGYDPSSTPAGSTSPWSTPVTFRVNARVLSPSLIHPSEGTAVPVGEPLTFRWVFRSMANPPAPQYYYAVHLTRVATGQSQTVAEGYSAGGEVTVPWESLPGWARTPGQYEWAVYVADSTWAGASSTVATFWVADAPGNPGALPDPNSADQGSLGIGTHRAFIYRKGGVQEVGELKHLSLVRWGRRRDDISEASVVISGWEPEDLPLLRSVRSIKHELVIYRDNGVTSERVWEGPITRVPKHSDKMEIHARDVMWWPSRRIIKQKMMDFKNGDTVVNRAYRVLLNVLAPEDPNILKHVYPVRSGDDARQHRSLEPWAKTAFDEIDDMAANAGLDYTVVGRSILLWGTKNAVGTLPELREEHLGAPPVVTEYGMDAANLYAVTNGSGIYGAAIAVSSFGPLAEEYGLVEMLSSTWSSDDQEPLPADATAEQKAKQAESFRVQAARGIANRFPPPNVIRLPENTTLSPTTPLSIQHLVPGVRIPLRAESDLYSVVGFQKLDSLSVEERVTKEGRSESVRITMSPFNSDDAAGDGEQA